MNSKHPFFYDDILDAIISLKYITFHYFVMFPLFLGIGKGTD